MCLIFQKTRFQVQVLKQCMFVQETSGESIGFQSSTASSIDTISVEVYEIQFFRVDFTPIHDYVFRLSFLTTLNIYKDYFKGRKRFHKCEAKFCSCKLWPKTKFALVHLSLEEATVFVHLRVLWPRSFMIFIVWWIEELCSQHLSQVGDQVTYWDPCIYCLVTYWESCIENERLSL